MKLIIPLARLERHSHDPTELCPLISVAGKPLLSYLLDQVISLKPEEVIFILGEREKEIMNYVKDNYSLPARFIKQKQVKGSAHAIYGAKPYCKDDVMILFGDTFFTADIKNLPKENGDGVIWVHEVPDPRELGVVFMSNNHASKLIEKPDSPVSNLAMIGLYYFKNSEKLFDSIDFIIKNNIKTRDSFHLTDAVQLMINRKVKIKTRVAKNWIDCGHDQGLFELNDLLLKKNHSVNGKVENCVIHKPVFISKDAVLKNSVVGPCVSVGGSAKIEGSIIEHSVVGRKASIKHALLSKSILGRKAKVEGSFRHLKLGNTTHFSVE